LWTQFITRMEGRAQREATRNKRGRGGDGREVERRGVEERGEGRRKGKGGNMEVNAVVI